MSITSPTELLNNPLWQHYSDLPAHLRAFISPVAEEDYTETDHQTWRTMMSRLYPFWEEHMHEEFLPCLKKTGVTMDKIPHVVSMDKHLRDFGWRAVPVDGFIPPAIFMEFHSMGILPIARNIRRPENLEYTPAPDIVHEAAGHAPMLANPRYAQMAKRFGELAMKAGFSTYDQEVYEAIRHLSTVKEQRITDAAEIEAAEKRLKAVCEASVMPSVGAKLSRLYWWTVEYGLIGTVENPKIYGAGIVSSIQEGKTCLEPSTTKLPISLECIEVGFDITRPQPQLFVTPDFETVWHLLDDFEAKLMK